MTADFRKMDFGSDAGIDGQPYHCCAEWHLARLGGACALVHPFALRISHRTKIFACSAVSVGRFFDKDPSTIRRAYDKLEEAGYFEKKHQGCYGPSSYKVLTHDEWAMKFPRQCPLREEMPWADGKDELGHYIYMLSGTKVKPRDFQIKNLRKLGFSDDEVKLRFERYYEQAGHSKKPSNVMSGFYFDLKDTTNSPGVARD
jgi:hypothetical protein